MNETASQDKNKAKAKIEINAKWCKKCGICTAFCPRGVFVSDDFGAPTAKYPEKCIKCMLCVVRCPDFAIDVLDVEDPVRDKAGRTRRQKISNGEDKKNKK